MSEEIEERCYDILLADNLTLKMFNKAKKEVMSEEKNIEEQAREHCNLLQHPLCGIDIYSAFILGAKAQRKICDKEEAHRWAALLKHLMREGLLTQKDIEDIREGLRATSQAVKIY